MKNIKDWIIFILLFIWQLPQNLVALVMMPFLGKLTLKTDRNYCLGYIGTRMSGGISLGNFAFFSTSLGQREPEVAHEVDGHTVDSKIFGPLYLIIIGLPSILNAMFDFTECYYDFYTERLANKHAGLEVVKQGSYYILKFKDAE